MNTSLERWIQKENRWMAEYRDRILKRIVQTLMLPMALILALVMAGMSLIGGASLTGILMTAALGAGVGVLVSFAFMLTRLPGLRAGRMGDGIREQIEALGMDVTEQEHMAGELMEASEQENRRMDFVMSGPGADNTPAGVIVSQRYAYMRGGVPLVNIIRLTDVKEIRPGEKMQDPARNGRGSKGHYFTLYTIEFYYRIGALPAGADENQPGAVMGFFSREQRNEALELIRRRGRI